MMLKGESLRAFELPESPHSLIASESEVKTKSEYSDCLMTRLRFTPAPGA